MKKVLNTQETNLQELNQPLSPEEREARNQMLQEGAKDAILEAVDMMRLWLYLEEVRSRDYVINFNGEPQFQEFEKKARLRQRAFSGDNGSSQKDLEKIDGDLEEYYMEHDITIDENSIEEKVREFLYAEKNEANTKNIINYIREGVLGATIPDIVIQPHAEAETETDEEFEQLYTWLCAEMENSHMEGENMARLRFKLEALEQQGFHPDIEKKAAFKRIIRVINQRKQARSGIGGTGIDAHIRALTMAIQEAGIQMNISQRNIEEGVQNLLLTSYEY